MNTIPTPPQYHLSNQSEAGEFLLINRLISQLSQPPFSHPEMTEVPGIGDDTAIIPSSIVGKYLLLTVDSFIEGRHFLFSLSTPKQIGYKAMATAVSDIAAMGGTPKFILINLHLPKDFNQKIVEDVYGGIDEFCQQFGTSVIGGNISSSLEFSLAATVIGECEAKPLTRQGLKVGDDLWVSGLLGLSHMALTTLKDKVCYTVEKAIWEQAESRYQRPEPRIELGKKILALGASGAIDVSDGVLQDCRHLATSSNVKLEINLPTLSIPGLTEEMLTTILLGGGDYELLFSAPPELSSKLESLNSELPAGCRLIKCGKVLENARGGEILINDGSGSLTSSEFSKKYNISSLGNDHFAGVKI